MSEKGIYLAGPIEKMYNPGSWRDGVKERYPDVNFIDPLDWQDVWEEDRGKAVDMCMEAAIDNDVLVYKMGKYAPDTTGTHYEIAWAIKEGNDVAIVRTGPPKGFVQELDVKFFRTTDGAMDWLNNE